MSFSASEWVDKTRRFLAADLWRRELRPGSIAATAVRLVQLGVIVGEGFIRDQLLLRATGLSYMTLLSVVPLLAITFSILSALGVSEDLVTFAAGTLSAGVPEAEHFITDAVRKANIGGLGTIGAGILLVTTVLALRQIEETFNQIWGVHDSRGWMRRFTDYLAVIVVAPMLAAMAMSLATTLQNEPLVEHLLEFPLFSKLYAVGLTQMPKLFLIVAFTFLYWFFPNTNVRPIAAVVGGVIASLLFLSAQSVYVQFNVGAVRANALFGAFSVLPLFLAWNYLSWAIVLLGAEISFAIQNLSHYQREVRDRAPTTAEQEVAGLRITVEVALAFRDSGEPREAGELADALQLSVRTVRDMLHKLEEARVVSACAVESREGAYQLGRPAEKIQVADVLAAIRGTRSHEVDVGDDDAAAVVSGLLDELESRVGSIASERTVADLIDTLPPRA